MWAVIVLDPPGLPWSCSWKLVLLHYVFSFCYIGLWIWTIFSVLKRTNLYRNPKNPEVSEQVCPTSRGKSILSYLTSRLLENRLLSSPPTPRVDHGYSFCEDNPENVSSERLGRKNREDNQCKGIQVAIAQKVRSKAVQCSTRMRSVAAQYSLVSTITSGQGMQVLPARK
ncbi:unnamed protein product [Calicophoron daubneyi]|uniref:ATP synthase F0 subunit 8 n=1 Tax=Calicophoron daubneyi TaxID=300641 RepID=A0AAV2TAJ2_CALDB